MRQNHWNIKDYHTQEELDQYINKKINSMNQSELEVILMKGKFDTKMNLFIYDFTKHINLNWLFKNTLKSMRAFINGYEGEKADFNTIMFIIEFIKVFLNVEAYFNS